MKIPLVDLKRQYQSIKGEIDEAIARVIGDSAFILGKYTAAFEQSFADYCGVKYCVGLNSGTDGLHLAYRVLGIGPGDEVMTVANTFFATTEPLYHLGAKPVFVDIDRQTYLIDTAAIESKITKKTKAIVPVHLYGQMANMTQIRALARKYHLKVIEDCAQAHGATHRGKKAGSLGDIGVYSFYPGKNLGAYGDAGCIITNNQALANTVRKLRDHGRMSKYEHELFGYSSRVDGLQAAILTVKLRHLDRWTDRRRSIAKRYTALLPGTLKKPIEAEGNRHVYHLYTVEVDRRAAIANRLRHEGIEVGIHYPRPLHQQPAYQSYGFQHGLLPITETVADRILSLPLFPEMTEDEIKFIAKKVTEALS